MTYDELMGEYVIAIDVAHTCYEQAKHLQASEYDEYFPFTLAQLSAEVLAQTSRAKFIAARLEDNLLSTSMLRWS